jgi:hypothetical protein
VSAEPLVTALQTTAPEAAPTVPAEERVALAPVPLSEPVEVKPSSDVTALAAEAPLPVVAQAVADSSPEEPTPQAAQAPVAAVAEPIPGPATVPGPRSTMIEAAAAALQDRPVAPPSAGPVAVDLDQALQDSGLVMVATNPDRAAQPAPESPAPALGRKPRPPVVIDAEPLQQVETQK